MATATLLSPSAPHHPHQVFQPSAYSPTSIAGMISPTESRRTSDDPEPSHRQSLPSIREVISGTKPGSYATVVASSGPAAPSLPSPFSTSAPPRPFSDVPSEKHVSPRTLYPPSSFPPRPETMSTLSDPARSVLPGRPPPPPPPLSTYSGQQPSPPRTIEHVEVRHRQPLEAQPFSGSYTHQPHQPPPPPPPASALYPQSGQLPPGQLPMPEYPVSPRHAGQPMPSPFDPQRPPMYADERGNKYETTLNRAFVAWSYSETLNRVSFDSFPLAFMYSLSPPLWLLSLNCQYEGVANKLTGPRRSPVLRSQYATSPRHSMPRRESNMARSLSPRGCPQKTKSPTCWKTRT